MGYLAFVAHTTTGSSRVVVVVRPLLVDFYGLVTMLQPEELMSSNQTFYVALLS